MPVADHPYLLLGGIVVGLWCAPLHAVGPAGRPAASRPSRRIFTAVVYTAISDNRRRHYASLASSSSSSSKKRR